QLSLHWDPTVAAYLTADQMGLTGMTFGTTRTNEGILTLSWDDPDGLSQSVADGTMLFAVGLQITGPTGTSGNVWLDGAPTPMEAADLDLRMVPVAAIPGAVYSSSVPVALQIADSGSPPSIKIAIDSGGGVFVWWKAFP